MRPWTKMLMITLVVGIPAFLVGPVLWPPVPEMPMPTSGQMPFFILLALIEALLFGFGIAFMVMAFPHVRRDPLGSPVLSWGAFVSLVWLLISWWPHDNLHIHTNGDMQALLLIEYGFHATLIVAGLVLALAFGRILRQVAAPSVAPAASDAPDALPARG